MVLRYFLKKVPSQLIPRTGLCIQNVRHFLVIFSYHDQKLQKFSKYFGENLNRGVILNRIAVQIISKATV